MRKRGGVVLVLSGLALMVAGCGGSPGSTARTTRSQAVEATATASSTPTAKKPTRRYRTLDEAVEAIARRVDVPVALPAGLPPNMRLAVDPTFAGGGAQLILRGGRRNLIIEYGSAGFDGCGPTDPQVVEVGRHDGVMQVHRRGKRPYTTLVWPATPRKPVGRYGLSGDFDGAELLRMAATMNKARSNEPVGKRMGC